RTGSRQRNSGRSRRRLVHGDGWRRRLIVGNRGPKILRPARRKRLPGGRELRLYPREDRTFQRLQGGPVSRRRPGNETILEAGAIGIYRERGGSERWKFGIGNPGGNHQGQTDRGQGQQEGAESSRTPRRRFTGRRRLPRWRRL